jgi:hypothetical protein
VSPFYFVLLLVYSSLHFVADRSSILSYAGEKLELKADREESTVCSSAGDDSTTSKRSLFRFMRRRGRMSTDSSSGMSTFRVGYVARKLLCPLLSSLAVASRVALLGDCPKPPTHPRQTPPAPLQDKQSPDVRFSTGLLMRFVTSRRSDGGEGR